MSKTNTDSEWAQALSQSEEGDTTLPKAPHIPEYQGEEEYVDVAIIGGGIAGFAVAAGLSLKGKDSNNGLSFKVYEKAKELRSSSQGMLALRTPGLKALEALGPEVLAAVQNSGSNFCQSRGTIINNDGTILNAFENPTGQKELERTGYYSILIQWSALQNALASFVNPEYIVTDSTLSSYEEIEEDEDGEGHVRIKFENGRVVKCKALLACDGVFSNVRKQMSFPNDNVIFFGQLNWNSILPTKLIPSAHVHPPNTVQIVKSMNDNGQCDWFSFLNDCGNKNTFWNVRVPDEEKSMSLSVTGRGGLGLVGTKKMIQGLISNHKGLHEVVGLTPEENIFERCILGRDVVPSGYSWSGRKLTDDDDDDDDDDDNNDDDNCGNGGGEGGRITLVGDAAHAMHPAIGYGGNSAIMGASTLVGLICGDEGGERQNDMRFALRRYEEVHRKRIKIIQQYANLIGCSFKNTNDLSADDKAKIDSWLEISFDDLSEKSLPLTIIEKLHSFSLLDKVGISRL